MMDRIIPISELRNHLAETCGWIEEEHRPVILTKNGRGRFVMLDIDSYNDLLETAGNGETGADAPRRQTDARPRETEPVRPQHVERTPPQPEPTVPDTAEAETPEPVQPAQPGMSAEMREEEDRILRELGLL